MNVRHTGWGTPFAVLLLLFLSAPSYLSSAPVDNKNKPEAAQTAKDIVAAELQDKSPLAESMAKKEADLKKREEALKKEEERLSQVKKELTEEMARLSSVRNDIEKMLADNRAALGMADETQEKKLRQLAKILESMPPEQLAPVMEKLELNLALSVISRMKPKQAAKVMAAINPELSAQISRKMGKAEPLQGAANIPPNK